MPVLGAAMAEPQYLKRRVGKGRSGDRLYVRMPIPKSVQAQFGGRKTLERALNTSDPREARRRKHIVVAELIDRIERARIGGDGLTSLDIEEIAQLRFQELMVAIGRKPMDTFQDDEVALAGEGDLWQLEDDLAEGDLAHVERQVQRIARERGLVLTRERHDELAQALMRAEITALHHSLALHRRRSSRVPRRF